MIKNPLAIKTAIGLILILFLFSALTAIGFDINKKAVKIIDFRQIIKSRSQLIKNLSILRSDLNQAQPFMSGLDSLMIDKDKLINFSSDLNSFVSQAKIRFSSSFTGEESRIGNLGWIGLAISGEGNSDNFIQFLKYLENGRYFTQFDNFEITNKDNNSKFALNGRVFYFAD